jgi:hypothetical protein
MEHIKDMLKPSLVNKHKRRNKKFSTVLNQRSRDNGMSKNKKTREAGDLRRKQRAVRIDSIPQHEAIRSRNSWGRYAEVRFEPFMHLLEDHKGQIWDDVYSKIKKTLFHLEKMGVDLEWFFWRKVAVYSYKEDGQIVLINSQGKHILLKDFDWFYVHPDTKCLMSNRNDPQIGPFPKKAKWKLEKEKAKREKQFGAKPKKQHIYNIEKVHTQYQMLLKNRVYDVELIHGLEPSPYTYRVRLMEIKRNYDGLVFVVRILKSSSETIQRGETLELEEFESRYGWRRAFTSFSKWKMFDAGELDME